MRVEIIQKGGTKVVNLNRRKAIRERCLNCSAWSPSEVKDCTFTDCKLYPYRMGTGKQDAGDRNRAIRDYCGWCSSSESRLEVGKCPVIGCSLFPYRKSGTDRSVEYPFLLKKQHIGAVYDAKTENVAYVVGYKDAKRRILSILILDMLDEEYSI